MNDNDRRGFLKEEYLALQTIYENFNSSILTIKGWASTVAIAALTISFGSGYELTKYLPLCVIAISFICWYFEADWKLYQRAFSDRIRTIEAYFREDTEILHKNPAPFQIYHSWYESYWYDPPIYKYELNRHSTIVSRFLASAFRLSVVVFYLPMILLSVYSQYLILQTTTKQIINH